VTSQPNIETLLKAEVPIGWRTEQIAEKIKAPINGHLRLVDLDTNHPEARSGPHHQH
jgi:hypothetical protein